MPRPQRGLLKIGLDMPVDGWLGFCTAVVAQTLFWAHLSWCGIPKQHEAALCRLLSLPPEPGEHQLSAAQTPDCFLWRWPEQEHQTDASLTVLSTTLQIMRAQGLKLCSYLGWAYTCPSALTFARKTRARIPRHCLSFRIALASF